MEPTKTEEWKPEKIIGGNDINEIVVPFGQTQEKLVPGLHYSKPFLGGQYFVGTVTYTTTGTKTVTGAGFTPRLIRITTTLTSGAISHGVYFNGSVNCSYYYTGAGAGDASGQAGYSAYLVNAGNATITTTIIPTSDGFTIVVSNVSGGAISIIYECYG